MSLLAISDAAGVTINNHQFAEILGVSKMTIRRMREAGELPPIVDTTRRIVRWRRRDVELWLELDCPKESDFRALKKTQRKLTSR